VILALQFPLVSHARFIGAIRIQCLRHDRPTAEVTAACRQRATCFGSRPRSRQKLPSSIPLNPAVWITVASLSAGTTALAAARSQAPAAPAFSTGCASCTGFGLQSRCPGQSPSRSRVSAGSSAGGQRLESLRRKSVSW
jgi:hypothetical protein